MSAEGAASIWRGALSERDREALGMLATLQFPFRMRPGGSNPVANRTTCDKLVELGLATWQLEEGGARSYVATFYGKRVHQMLKEPSPCQTTIPTSTSTA